MHPSLTISTEVARIRPSGAVLLLAVCLIVGGAVLVLAAGCGPAPGTAGAAPSAETDRAAIEAEFRKVAEKWLMTPGSQIDITQSAAIRKQIDQAKGNIKITVPLQLQLANALLREDKTQEAVAEIEALFAAVKPIPGALEREWRFHWGRAMAYLRLAEIENCINRHNDECCVFPLKGGGVHSDKNPATEAAKSFLDYLKIKPDDLNARWLLNIAGMAAGNAELVPEKLRIPEIGPNSSAGFPRFREISTQCGITQRNFAGGVIADDMDGDGLDDLVLSSSAPDARLSYFRGKPDGTFEERAAAAGIDCQLGGLDLLANDYDNDGDLDILVLRGAWMFDLGRVRMSLLRNDGRGNFTDVTHAAGLAEPAYPTQTGVWFDYDNDGDLDLFVGHESRMDRERYPKPTDDFPSSLYRNDGGKFTDVAKQAGVLNDRYCKGVTAGDYDDDGWPDLYLSNMGRNRLYRNNHDGTFTDVAEKLQVMEPVNRSFAPWFFDFDNDGHLDIYVSGYDTDVTQGGEIAAWHLGLPFTSPPPRLYRNKGDGTFEDVTRSAGLWRPMCPMGANFGDLDNDGWLDMYLTTGAPAYDMIMPHVMLRNVDGKSFVDVTVAGGFGNLQKGHGVAFVDLDHDGDQDVFNEVGGFLRGDAFYNSLYENPGNSNHFLTLKLEGRRSNRLAYGARIKVVVKTPSGSREIHRAVGSVSSFGGSPARQEIGLGDATAITSVEIWWPASGTRQKLEGLDLDSFYTVVEGAASATKLTPPKLKLGGGK